MLFRSPRFEPDTYFQHTIGVSRTPTDEAQTVRLRAAPRQARYISTKPLHHTQRKLKTEADGKVVFAYQLTLNTELENVLLSFGEWIEVLAPDSLRQAIAQRLRRAGAQYGSGAS